MKLTIKLELSNSDIEAISDRCGNWPGKRTRNGLPTKQGITEFFQDIIQAEIDSAKWERNEDHHV